MAWRTTCGSTAGPYISCFKYNTNHECAFHSGPQLGNFRAFLAKLLHGPSILEHKALRKEDYV